MSIGPVSSSVFGITASSRSNSIQLGGGALLASKASSRGSNAGGDDLFGIIGAGLAAAATQRRGVDDAVSQLKSLKTSLQRVEQTQATRGPGSASEAAAVLTRDVYATRSIYQDQDVISTRDVHATRDVYETQAVYEQQDIRATRIDGFRNLSSYSRFSDAGISNNSVFTVAVGNGAAATVEFKTSTSIEVTAGGQTQTFSFASSGGAWRTGLVNALQSIGGLSASFNANGTLHFETANGQSLTGTNGANSPLFSLGFLAGTVHSSVVGSQQVQVGTQEVVVGQEQYVSGQEQYVSGQQKVLTATEHVKVATESVKLLTEPEPAARKPTQQLALSDIRSGLRDLATTLAKLSSAPAPGTVTSDRLKQLAGSISKLMQGASLPAAQGKAGHQDTVKQIEAALSHANAIKKDLADSSSRSIDAAQASVHAMLNDSSAKMLPLDLARATADDLRKTRYSLAPSRSLISVLS